MNPTNNGKLFDEIRRRTPSTTALPWWKPTIAGEELVGVVEETTTILNRNGEQLPAVIIVEENGTRVLLAGTRAALARLIQQHNPQRGDGIRIEYTGIHLSQRSGREFHGYNLGTAPGIGATFLNNQHPSTLNEPTF